MSSWIIASCLFDIEMIRSDAFARSTPKIFSKRLYSTSSLVAFNYCSRIDSAADSCSKSCISSMFR